jgi:hypothetical protein
MYTQDAETKEIYNIFLNIGIPKNVLDDWLRKINMDVRKTEGRLVDIALCVLIYKGFKLNHLNRLTARLLPHRCRARTLINRMRYLAENVVNTSIT